MIDLYNNLKLNLVVVILVSGLLVSCNRQDEHSGSENNTDWVKDEILQQLAELRKDVKSLKDGVAKLDSKIGTSAGIGNRRIVKAPKQVKLNAGMALGDANAKIAIVEFTDYQCPFCVRHYKTVMPQIKKQFINTGKVKYVMYDYPLSFHTQAKSASVAAHCAGKQGKYWEMHDVLFNNQRNLNEILYKKTANSLNLNGADFTNCLKDPAVLKVVESNVKYGDELGVTGTPKFYIGKVKKDVITDVVVISGAQPFSAFSRALTNLTK